MSAEKKHPFPDKPWLPNPAQWKDTWRDDWRIAGQEGYLLNCKLQFRTYSRDLCRDDFLQCEFCWDRFDKDPSNPKKAYYDPNGKHWICEDCFRDFKEHFHWITETIEEE